MTSEYEQQLEVSKDPVEQMDVSEDEEVTIRVPPVLSEEIPILSDEEGLPAIEVPVISEDEGEAVLSEDGERNAGATSRRHIVSTSEDEPVPVSSTGEDQEKYVEEPKQAMTQVEESQQAMMTQVEEPKQAIITRDEAAGTGKPEHLEEPPAASDDEELPAIAVPVISEDEEDVVLSEDEEQSVSMKSGISKDKKLVSVISKDETQEQLGHEQQKQEEETASSSQEKPVVSDNEGLRSPSPIFSPATDQVALDPQTTPEKKRRPDSPPPATPPLSKRLKLITGKSHHNESSATQDIRSFTFAKPLSQNSVFPVRTIEMDNVTDSVIEVMHDTSESNEKPDEIINDAEESARENYVSNNTNGDQVDKDVESEVGEKQIEDRQVKKAGRMKTPERTSFREVASPSRSPSRRSTRLRTPDRMLARAEPSTSHVKPAEDEDEQSSKNVNVDTDTQDTEVSSSDPIVRQSSRQSRTPDRVKKTEKTAPTEVFDTVLPVDAEDVDTAALDTSKWVRRSSRRHSKTPDRFNQSSKPMNSSDINPEPLESSFTRQTRGKSRSPTKADATESVLDGSFRRSRRQSKTPERFNKTDDAKASSSSSLDHSVLRRTRKGSKLDPISEAPSSPVPTSPSRRASRQTKTPDRAQASVNQKEEEPATSSTEVESVRRSKRQSRTPERLKGTVMSPVRQSQRVTRSPEKLNTPEIQAIAIQHLSPKLSPSKPTKSSVDPPAPPATPPKMSVSKSLSPSRKSIRKLKSPERLNTEDIEPVQSSSKSPIR